MASENSSAADRRTARATAVALNYCRASFHRIRRQPLKPVLIEEREKILNNLNLTEIADEELIKLYTAMLAEIADVQLAERELQLIRERHVRIFTREVAINALALSEQLASAQYLKAVKTGARSWWDYRTLIFNRKVDEWELEKARTVAVVQKSSQFLGTFWKLARRRNIPDRWLIRDDDLVRLEQALSKRDLQVRLRLLKRMQSFLQCYPPYWYYLARTQQSLGMLQAAAATYERMHELGDGHFRQDEMLAAGLANRAVIQEYLKRPTAAATAKAALAQATDGWDVNLVCAGVLARAGDCSAAEDAILRNLDMKLEYPHSIAALVLLRTQFRQRDKLTELLSDAAVVPALPAAVLLRAIQILGHAAPPTAVDRLSSTIAAGVDVRIGADDVVVRAAAHWQLPEVRAMLTVGDDRNSRPAVEVWDDGVCTLRFHRAAARADRMQLLLRYADETRIFIEFAAVEATSPLGLPTPRRSLEVLGLKGTAFRPAKIQLKPAARSKAERT